MTRDEFQAMYLGSWDMERERLLHDLGQQYHDRCDAFDDEHPHERRNMLRNAEYVRAHVISLGVQHDFTEREVVRAIQQAASNTGPARDQPG